MWKKQPELNRFMKAKIFNSDERGRTVHFSDRSHAANLNFLRQTSEMSFFSQQSAFYWLRNQFELLHFHTDNLMICNATFRITSNVAIS